MIIEAEYHELERISASKHEYFAGDIYAMAGASEQHNVIASNGNVILHRQLRGRSCRIYSSDMRLKVIHTGLITYPDITIICSPPECTNSAERDTLINPTVIIEILSLHGTI